MKRRESALSPAGAAVRGAAAGLIGGLTLTALDRLLLPRLGEAGHRERDWDEGVADTLARLGVHLSQRERTTAAIATGLAYSALLGAAYGVARWRWRSSPPTLRLLDAILVYAVSIVSPEPRRRARSLRRRKRSGATRAVSSVAVFGRTTAAAYKAFARRVG
jgi:hypothetical protein